jgi:glyoxylase-like metal-dependent hydrolase (beta-lactamase superfamily II)
MRRSTLVRLAGLTLAIGGLWHALTQQQPQPLTVEKIADDLHVIVGSGGNVAVLTTNDGVILVDDKFERNVPEILAKVKSITDKPIKYVINTHQHGDHTGGNQSLLTSAEIFAHKNAQANMRAGNQPGVPRIAFADELVVALGGKEVRARHFGAGHTNGDAVIYFPAHRVAHMGDLFVRGAPFIDYSAGGNSEAWIKTIDGALSLGADTWIPGHGAISKRADLVQFQSNIRTLRSRVQELTRKGVSKEQMQAQLKLDDLGWQTTAGLFAKSLPGLYDEVSRAR